MLSDIYLNSIYDAVNLFKTRRKAKGQNAMTLKHIMGKAKSDRGEGVIFMILNMSRTNPLGIQESVYYFVALRSEFWPAWSRILNEDNQIPTKDIGSFGETILDRVVDDMKAFMKQYGPDNIVYDVFLRDGTEHYIKTKDLIFGYFEKYNSWATHLKYKNMRDCWGYPNRILSDADPFDL